MTLFYTCLHHRQILQLEGDDTIPFLQGLITADAHKLTQQEGLYAAFLTPQGKFLEDLIAIKTDSVLWLDSFKESSSEFIQKLKLYKLRSKVNMSLIETHQVYAIWGKDWMSQMGLRENTNLIINEFGLIFKDPRLPDLGGRAYLNTSAFLKQSGAQEVSLDDYDRHRMSLGIPDGARDLEHGKAILLENGFDDLGAIDWDKGCYLGQELTSRTKYRGLVRKRLLPFRYEGNLPLKGELVYYGEEEVGQIRSTAKDVGLGFFRLEHLSAVIKEGAIVKSSSVKIYPYIPKWMHIKTEDLT